MTDMVMRFLKVWEEKQLENQGIRVIGWQFREVYQQICVQGRQ